MTMRSILLLIATNILIAQQADGFAPSPCGVNIFRSTPISKRNLSLNAKQINDDDNNKNNSDKDEEPLPIRRALIGSTLLATSQLLFSSFFAPSGFDRIPTQFIAALGDPDATSGTNANEWGLWRDDPGPRGVFLQDYESKIINNNGYAPDGWIFNKYDWWLEEHGIIMPSPDFPVPPGRYLVTGGRLVTTPLTIREDGAWKLDQGKLYDVTHLPCRSARYHPTQSASSTTSGSPATARTSDFPVFPGAAMPEVPGCEKEDYAVLFIIGKAKEEE